MRRLALALLCIPLAVPASLHAQVPAEAGGRITLRVVGGYSFGYRREFGGEEGRPRPGPAPGFNRTEEAWDVEGKPVVGAELEYGITARLGVRGGVLRRPQAYGTTCSDITRACSRALIDEGALWLAKLGLAWSPSEHLPLSLSFAPLWVRRTRSFGRSDDHWGVSLGAGVEVPLGSSRAAIHAGLEDHVVFWRTASARPSQLVVLRAGLVYRP